MNNRILYVLRGLPGSGKSYYAKKLVGEEGCIFHVDDYWLEGIQPNDDPVEYYKKNWTIESVGRAHSVTYAKVCDAMNRCLGPLVVDGVHDKRVFMGKYVISARRRGYDVEIHEPDSPWWKSISANLKAQNWEQLKIQARDLVSRNTHGVPLKGIMKMMKAWDCDVKPEDFPYEFEKELEDV